MNGHKLTASSGQYNVAKDAKLTVKNGELVVNDSSYQPFYVNVGGSLSLQNLKMTGAYTHQIIVNEGTADVTGADFNLPNAQVLYTAKAGAKATLNGKYNVSSIVSVMSSTAAATKINPASTVSVNGTYTTAAEAMTLTGGVVVTVNGATINSDQAVARVNGAELVVTSGDLYAKGNGAIIVNGTTDATKLTVNGGTIASETAYAIYSNNTKAVYKITDGTFESSKNMKAAIELDGAFTKTEDGVTTVVPAIKGILTGGKYLTNIIAKVVDTEGGTVDVTNQLVAEGYTVKTEDPYKVVVSTKAEDDKKPAAKPDEQAPNTYDAGLVYMGLALSAIGASVVSVRKLRN